MSSVTFWLRKYLKIIIMENKCVVCTMFEFALFVYCAMPNGWSVGCDTGRMKIRKI